MNPQPLQKSQFPKTYPRQYSHRVEGKVNIKPLKVLVFEKFPKDCVLRDVLLSERDLLNVTEFLAKMETWLKLLQVV